MVSQSITAIRKNSLWQTHQPIQEIIFYLCTKTKPQAQQHRDHLDLDHHKFYNSHHIPGKILDLDLILRYRQPFPSKPLFHLLYCILLKIFSLSKLHQSLQLNSLILFLNRLLLFLKLKSPSLMLHLWVKPLNFLTKTR